MPYILRKLDEALAIGTTLRGWWFRGHHRPFGTLVPSVFRTPAGSRFESWASKTFRDRAPSLVQGLPDWLEHVPWLLLMQHNRTPTRLLDWTESILVALFFATEAGDHDAELWCLRPEALNGHSDTPHVPNQDNYRVRYLAAEAFDFAPYDPNPPRHPIAFLPPFNFPRMSAQQSRFTIHPADSEERKTGIERVLSLPNDLARYSIPAEYKAPISRDLRAIGITHELLFHDLEALSRTICEQITAGPPLPSLPPEF